MLETKATDDASISTRLAVMRTHQANERTLMAWVRTATSLITFGFTIYKFFEFQVERGVKVQKRLLGPREFAMIMIGIGVTALILATLQHGMNMRRMSAEYGKSSFSVAILVASLISGLGALALMAVFFRE